MPFLRKSFLDVKNLSVESVLHLFEIAKKIRTKNALWPQNKTISLVFAEPSTRTSSSFEMAAHWLGVGVMKLDASFSSLQKGETLLDTILNLEAMGPDAIVVRHGSEESLSEIAKQVRIPIVNAGERAESHPTQALLDAFTILEERGQLKGERILIVGDVTHSRVARSNFHLFVNLGAEIGVCAPSELTDKMAEKLDMGVPLTQFSKIEDGLKWATVCMVLRMQRERHEKDLGHISTEYIRNFRIDTDRLTHFSKEGILMSPGPVNREFEITSEALADSRSRVLTQVRNGVIVRAALLSQILGVTI